MVKRRGFWQGPWSTIGKRESAPWPRGKTLDPFDEREQLQLSLIRLKCHGNAHYIRRQEREGGEEGQSVSLQTLVCSWRRGPQNPQLIPVHEVIYPQGGPGYQRIQPTCQYNGLITPVLWMLTPQFSASSPCLVSCLPMTSRCHVTSNRHVGAPCICWIIINNDYLLVLLCFAP